MSVPRYIVVIGTSLGGRSALIELVSQFRADMDCAFFIVMHVSRTGVGGFLAKELQKFTALPCGIAENDTPIEAGRIYYAPANGHLVIKRDKILIGHGPEENRWRPSIDVLFRSAAAAYTSQVIGIILTGLLHDGTSGMLAVKRCNGICLVQDPEEAEYPEMPLSVLEKVEVDYILRLGEVGEILTEVLSREPKEFRAPADVVAEAEIAEKTVIGYENVAQIGELSKYACPDCGGGLWKIEDKGLERYRCHIGHSYLQKELLSKQGENLESTMWIALRMMEEKYDLLNKMGKEQLKRGFAHGASRYSQSADEMQKHVEALKRLLFETKKIEFEGQQEDEAVPGTAGYARII